MQQGARLERPSSPPLFVDLDGTLIRNDLLVESLILLIKSSPVFLLWLPIWLLRGKAHLKHEIATRVKLDASTLPYNAPFLAFLRSEHDRGREIVLATGSHRIFGESVAAHLGIFSAVLATDGSQNLTGTDKLAKIREFAGKQPFHYAGNAWADLSVWEGSERAILVDAPKLLEQKVKEKLPVERQFTGEPLTLKSFLRTLRVHQWVKNFLILMPVFTGHRLTDPVVLLRSATAFLSFSLCASAIYIINDLLDLPEDRKHPEKRSRPIAAGNFPAWAAAPLALLLLVSSFSLGHFLSLRFQYALAGYIIVTTAYSFRLKRVPLLDVIVLAGLYTYRVFVGSIADSIPFTNWLLGFSMFFFLSLAYLKRFTELQWLKASGRGAADGKGYLAADSNIVMSFGIASGFVSVLVLILYIHSPEVRSLYRNPDVLWLIAPVILHWLSRIWLVAQRGDMTADPIVFAARDRMTYVSVLIVCVFAFLGT